MIEALASLAADPRRRNRAASAVLLSLLFGYGAIVYLADDGVNLDSSSSKPRPNYRRSLLLKDAEYDSRLLAKNGESPKVLDEIPGQYIIKPWVGYAANDVWETREETKVDLLSCQSSSVRDGNSLPRNAIDDPSLNTVWASATTGLDPDDVEWLNIDMGMPQSVAEFYIKWTPAYARHYEIQVSRERQNCRSDGTSCPDSWITVVVVTGKADAEPTHDVFQDADHTLQGVRYVRLKMIDPAPGYNYYSLYDFRVYRKRMIVDEASTGVSCGATIASASSALLSKHGGTLIQTYENAKFFSASMTVAQKDAMFADPCTFTVEPNYVVRERGRGKFRTRVVNGESVRDRRRRLERLERQNHRRLAIPEFNLKDENPPNWGLQRISSHGKLNGMYIWFHEGMDTHMYIFDTGVYPDHSDWNRRDGTSRIEPPLVCAGLSTDYQNTDHGTHIASIAAGFTFGTAKSTIIHPIQVLDDNGKGSTASFLCGVEKLLADGIAYNAANAPKKIRGIVNLSLGVNGRSDALDKAVEEMTEVGYTVVIAAGDRDDNACFYSPYHKAAITVGALKDHPLGFNDKTATSNYGECIDLWAPGEGIFGASNIGEFDSVMKSGTSVASAFVAGAAALFFEEINTEEYTIEEFAAAVKDKIIKKAEVNILGDIGHGSPNRNAQTTSSRCLINSHCMKGLTCLRDGTCADLSKPLKKG